jgi:hypothetical protein
LTIQVFEETLAMMQGCRQPPSSMLEDLERGRPLELPWLSGAVVRIGSRGGRGNADPSLHRHRAQAARHRRRQPTDVLRNGGLLYMAR